MTAHGRTGERGAAFLIALGALALISALAAAALSLTVGPATRAAAAVAQAQAARTAEAAAHRLIAAAAADEHRRSASLDGTVISTEFLGAKIDFAAQDAGGLIDVNTAQEVTLARLFALTGAAEPQAMASTLVRARSSLDARAGWSTPEAALASLPEEMQADAAAARAHLTAWSGRPGVDPWTATAPALAAAANLSLEAAQEFVARRALEGRQATPPETREPGAYLASEGHVARITVRAETTDGGRAEVAVAIRATGSPRAPVTILSWR